MWSIDLGTTALPFPFVETVVRAGEKGKKFIWGRSNRSVLKPYFKSSFFFFPSCITVQITLKFVKYLWKIQRRYPGKKFLTQIFYEQEVCGKKKFPEGDLGAKADHFDVDVGWTLTWRGGAQKPVDWPSVGPSLPFVLAQTTQDTCASKWEQNTHTSQDAKRGVDVTTRAPGDGRRPQGGSEGAYSAYARVCLHLSVLGLPGTHTWWQIVEIQGAGRKEE